MRARARTRMRTKARRARARRRNRMNEVRLHERDGLSTEKGRTSITCVPVPKPVSQRSKILVCKWAGLGLVGL